MAFNPTIEQQKAIEKNGNILVSAAAGSGKTAVLVERVISKLTDKVNPISADKLLIVTFTNAAAAEMRTRIEKRLAEECNNHPDDVGLLRQKHLLGSAKICTIDSFCIDLVRENFEKIGINHDFKMSDGYSLKPIDEKVIGDIINSYLEKNDSVFNQLLDIVGAEYDEGNFADFILEVYNYSRQMPFPDKWFDLLENLYNNGKFNADSSWYKYAFQRAEEIISSMQTSLSTAIDLVSVDEKALNLFLTDFLQLSEILNEMLEKVKENDWDRFYQSLISFNIPSLKRGGGFTAEYEVAVAKSIWKDLSKDVEKLNRFFYNSSDFINAQFSELIEPIRLLVKILKKFENDLFCEYNRQNTFTFHNTEHLALSLLCTEQDGVVLVKPGAEEFLKQYDEVMVDEYQDTNDLQDMLFYVLSGKESKLFVVGDVKQSIYGFRGANPYNFLQKKNRYIPIDNASESDPLKIILGNNFRCHPEVCKYINFFFENLMNEETGNIVYNDEEKLIPAAVFPENGEIPTQLDIIDCDGCEEDKLVLEARHIADFIKRTMAQGECIKQNETTLRNAKFSDFTILLRSARNKSTVLASELRKQGIPVNYSIEGYAETVEIETFLSLLKVIDNPKSDIELLCVMMSPIFGFSSEEMAKIRINHKKGDLFSAVVFAFEQGDKHIADFLSRLESYRLLSVTLTIPKLISRLLIETEYLNIVSAMEYGTRRRNNLLMLCDYAEQFVLSSNAGLGSFVKYVYKQSENGMKSASVTSGADTVKIMSIHASKGLQFPVCIIADTASKFNDSDAKSNHLLSTNMGIGFRYYDEKLATKLTTVSREVIIDDIRKKSLEEELRLIYVAMTRTQDKLLFTTAVSNSEKFLDSYRLMAIGCNGKFGKDTFIRTKSYIDWLMLTAFYHPDCSMLRGNGVAITPKKTDSHIKISFVNANEIPNVLSADEIEAPVINEEIAKEIKNNIEFKYPFEELVSIEAKSSVSALANKAESEKYAFTERPAFMSDKGITATERGTAMHRIIQFIDFDKCDDVDGEIERLYEWQFITEREANAVNRSALKAFFASEVFKKIKNSPMVKREMRFLTEIKAGEINPNINKSFADEGIIVQGAVDLCFEEDNSIVVLDFKTDRVENASKLAECYGEQLSIYALACEKIFGKSVKQKLIYSFSLGTVVEID